MAGFYLNVNLCGASAVIGDVLSKLNSSQVAIKASISAPAVTTVAIVEGDKNQLTSLLGKAQTGSDWIDPDAEEIIDVVGEDRSATPLNLQSEIKVLNELPKGTQAYISAADKIITEFADDVAAAGSEILDVISKAYASFTGGSDPCSSIPNLQKIAGSTVAAKLLPSNIMMPNQDPIAEATAAFSDVAARARQGDFSELTSDGAAARGIEYVYPDSDEFGGD
jgi:hypothetical protein|tara:strand:- start:60 stop:728 length:669 start_codon:yes stop_codon:yes gene_type:complete